MIDINNIIIDLIADVPLNALVSDRIYWWAPKRETQTWIYIIVNIVTGNTNIIEKKNRVEFRIISHNEDVTFWDLKIVQETLMTALNQTAEEQKDYNGFKVYRVVESNIINMYDEKNRKVLIQDIIFNFSY